jgi:uncharacterized membrane protein
VACGGPVDADRVLAFSDAIFAIAITLLTLKLEVRPGLRGPEFTRDLRDLLPSLGAYVLSCFSCSSSRHASPVDAGSVP